MEKIILTDIPKYCPNNLPKGLKLENVNIKTLKDFNGNSQVIAFACSRSLARAIETYSFPNCRLVQLFSVGYDDINTDYFLSKKIALCNASGIYDNTLAEYVIFSMLIYAKRFHKSIKNWRFRFLRNYHYITELSGKTVGIMGCGRIGTAIAKRLAGFDVRILGYARNNREIPYFQEVFSKKNLLTFTAQCDFIINVLPHNDETIGLIDQTFLESCKDNVTFINIGRDSIFYKNDFYDYLKNHKNSTAILDMFDLLPTSILNRYRKLKNVLVFPRIAAISEESSNNLKELIYINASALMTGMEYKNRLI